MRIAMRLRSRLFILQLPQCPCSWRFSYEIGIQGGNDWRMLCWFVSNQHAIFTAYPSLRAFIMIWIYSDKDPLKLLSCESSIDIPEAIKATYVNPSPDLRCISQPHWFIQAFKLDATNDKHWTREIINPLKYREDPVFGISFALVIKSGMHDIGSFCVTA